MNVGPMLSRIRHWRDYLDCPGDAKTIERLRQHSRTGWPLGNDIFLDELAIVTGTNWRKRAPGPAPKNK